MQESDSIQAEWVKGYYSGEIAKYIKGLANEGIAYKILQEEGNSVVAAFRKPKTGPLPEHLQPILDPFQIKKLEDWMKK